MKENGLNIFGKNVFKEEYLEKSLSKKDFIEYKETINKNISLKKELAKKVADIVKEWAIENGATHYSHWFQPLTGITAEKQTSFLSVTKDNKSIIEFPGEALAIGETDASSFPNGGARSVFEARGLTKWDYTYPIFLKEDINGKVLCIPTILESPTGMSLDKRTPLLNSCKALNEQMLRLLKVFGNTSVKETFSTVGIEQEYFLIPKEYYKKRKDLMLTGRTLFGKELIPAINKHYMGSISEKTGTFMKKVEIELWKLGVPAKVKHNEVASRQYEIVPHFENLKYAANHDFLTMEILQREANNNNLKCLLHEKPFKGISGSGKHNNWSISTDEGENLFSYGKNAVQNARVILIITALISAVDVYSDLIRATVATCSNDNRLSGYEAPSSIVSIFLGEELTSVLDEIVYNKESKIELGKTDLNLYKTNITDRNRTSPFAFIGNRFEFRMPGASASVAVCNTVLNTVMADVLSNILDKLEKSENFYEDLKHIICDLYKKHSRIIYNGNSYSEEWINEAKTRNLKNIKSAPEAFKAFITPQSINLFEKFNVYSKEELAARYNVKLEKYIKGINTEADVMIDMAEKEILPAVIEYTNLLATIINNKKPLNVLYNVEKDLIEEISVECDKLYKNIKILKELLEKGKDIIGLPQKAEYYKDKICIEMEELRNVSDKLEEKIPKKYWPFPTYSDILN